MLQRPMEAISKKKQVREAAFLFLETYNSDTKEEYCKKVLMFENDIAKQYDVAQKIKKQLEMRETVNNKDGLASVDFLAPTLQLPQ